MGKNKLSKVFNFALYLFKNVKEKLSERYNIFIWHVQGGTNLFGNNHIQNSKIGKYSYIAYNSIVRNCIVGRYCSIGPNVIIGFGDHMINSLSTHPMIYMNEKQFSKTENENRFNQSFKIVEIGNDVWIGANVYIKNGVVIGNGAIIGAGSIVTKDVPPFAIVTGVPAKVIRFRFNETTIKHIEDSKWWDCNIDNLNINLQKFEKENIIEIIENVYEKIN